MSTPHPSQYETLLVTSLRSSDGEISSSLSELSLVSASLCTSEVNCWTSSFSRKYRSIMVSGSLSLLMPAYSEGRKQNPRWYGFLSIESEKSANRDVENVIEMTKLMSQLMKYQEHDKNRICVFKTAIHVMNSLKVLTSMFIY